jgi:hypothetical protein
VPIASQTKTKKKTCSSTRYHDPQEHNMNLKFEPLKRVVMKRIMQFSLVEVHERFGGTYCLHLQGRIIDQVSRTASVNLVQSNT